MAKFITGEQLTEGVYDIIHKAKKQLLIVSPYIKLDQYFKEELFEHHKKNSELHLIIGFGKNEKNPQRSLKKQDFEYFKGFPNVSIIFIPNLHAKYYANEKMGIITSINLYDYSFKNNVEFGVISESTLFSGSDIDKEAWNETMRILGENHTVFIRRPNYKKKFLRKDYLGSETKLDLTEQLLSGNLTEKHSVFDYMNESVDNEDNPTERLSRTDFDIKNNSAEAVLKKADDEKSLVSATNLGKLKDKSFDDVIEIMITKDYIVNKTEISDKGFQAGIQYKTSAKGSQWIVYPKSLSKIL